MALTVAGLDPSGGAGIIADVRTFAALGVYGVAVVSMLTYQSTGGVSGRQDLPPVVVREQLEALLSDRKPDALKTGVLGRADTIREVARLITEHELSRLVVDPVISSGSGVQLMEPGGLEALAADLVPRAALVTPNVEEAVRLCGFDVFDVEDMEAAALRLVKMGAAAALVTGGRLEEKGRRMAADVFFDGKDIEVFTSPWQEGISVHGTGCVLSAACAAGLALGMETGEAVVRAREVVASAIENAVRPGRGAACAHPTGDFGA